MLSFSPVQHSAVAGLGFALLLTSVPAPPAETSAGELARIQEARAEAFPPSAAVLDLATVGWREGMGQLAALRARLAADEPRAVIVDVGGAWCAPCRAEWPRFVEAASSADDEAIVFAALAVEENAPDRAAMEHFVRHRWNAGAPPTYPGHVVLEGSGRPVSERLLSLSEALDLARRVSAGQGAPEPGETATTRQERFGAFLAGLPLIGVRLDAATIGELAAQLEEQTGARLVVDRRLAPAHFEMTASGITPHGVIQTLATGLGLEWDVVPASEDGAVLVLWGGELAAEPDPGQAATAGEETESRGGS